MNVMEKYAGKLKMSEEDDELVTNFVRHFSIETLNVLTEAESLTLFREMPPYQKLGIFVQGVMITLAGVIKPSINEKFGDSAEFTAEFLKMNVDVGVANASEIEKIFKGERGSEY